MNRTVGRLAAATIAVAAGFVAAAIGSSAAAAHVDVEASPSAAGASKAVVTFSAESESTTAGIVSVRIVLPATIAPADIALSSAPGGWTFATTADGYQIAGPALPKGEDAVHAVTVTRLPSTRTVTFKALVTYSDGTVDRWIEEPSATNPTPDSPAPILTLSGALTPTVSIAAPTGAAVEGKASASASVPDTGQTVWIWWVVGAMMVIAVGLAVVFVRGRRARD